MIIAENLTTGSSTPVKIRGGVYNVQVTGTFDGTTATVEYGDGTNWFSEADSQFTSAGAINMTLPGSGYYFMRVTLSGGTSPSIDAVAIG